MPQVIDKKTGDVVLEVPYPGDPNHDNVMRRAQEMVSRNPSLEIKQKRRYQTAGMGSRVGGRKRFPTRGGGRAARGNGGHYRS